MFRFPKTVFVVLLFCSVLRCLLKKNILGKLTMTVGGPTVKLSNGAEMPLVGLGTWLVCFFITFLYSRPLSAFLSHPSPPPLARIFLNSPVKSKKFCSFVFGTASRLCKQCEEKIWIRWASTEKRWIWVPPDYRRTKSSASRLRLWPVGSQLLFWGFLGEEAVEYEKSA